MRKIATILAIVFALISCDDDSDSGFSLGPGDGIASTNGSTSGFAIVGDILYVVSGTTLKVIDISSTEVRVLEELQTTSTLETIFTRENVLFLGARNGVFIYDISTPSDPHFISLYTHQTACDPVIAYGSYAYITIRDGNNCGNINSNELITINIEELAEPVEVNRQEMIRPRGLGIYKGDLYVAEGVRGLKRFDISSPFQPALDSLYESIPANDLIGLSDQMIVTSNEGVAQYRLIQDSLARISLIR